MRQAASRYGRAWLRRAPVALLALAGVAAFLLFGDLLSLEALRENRAGLIAWRDAHLWTAWFTYLAVFAAAMAVSLPVGFALTVAGGFLFGLLPGTLLAVVASTLGASAVFLAARAGFGDALGPRWRARAERELRRNPLGYLLLLRLVPAVPFAVANVAPALVGVRLATFAATTFLGILPGTLVTAWIGVGIGEAFDRGGTPDLGLILEPHILGPTLGLCALAALPILARRGRDR